MESLPPEVLRMICTNLQFDDAANVRFLTHGLAVAAAEFLITRICFHSSEASLDRLEKISNHPTFSRTVKVLVYEAALLADVKCRHEYARHFEHDHHGLEKPKEPPTKCSSRERRLFDRNLIKWTQGIYAKYDNYRALFDAQKRLLDENKTEQVLSRCIPRFSKLTFIDIDPIRRCTHMTSRRFIEEFGSDCASPLSGSFSRIIDQFKWILMPNNFVIKSLRKLEINSLSPAFFKSNYRSSLQAAFAPLTDIDIILKLADGDVNGGENTQDCFHRHLACGVLKDALSSAVNLEFVSIGVDSALPLYVNIISLLPSTTWSQLKSLGLSTISSTQQEFMDILKRQPQLKSLHVALMQLTEGGWPETLTQMREQLDLRNFMPVGFLEDSQDSWPMELLHVPIYLESHEESDLSTAIDFYVTHEKMDPTHHPADLTNPLAEGFDDFEEPYLVREMYGDLPDSDSMSLDGLSNSDLSTMASDMSMPDVTGVDPVMDNFLDSIS